MHVRDLMPHEHENLDDYFPLPVACTEEYVVPEPEDPLERRGKEIGMEAAQVKRRVRS